MASALFLKAGAGGGRDVGAGKHWPGAGIPVTSLGAYSFGDSKCRFFPSRVLCGPLGYFSDAI